MSQELCNVQQKISCIFDTIVVEGASTKRAQQQYKVVAGDTVKQAAVAAHIDKAIASEKLDGTCVFISTHGDKPWLWARLDRKPNKVADRKFKKFQAANMQRSAAQTKKQNDVAQAPEGQLPETVTQNAVTFSWDVDKDFKVVPENWIPAFGVPKDDQNVTIPDTNGHIPGWVPVDWDSRQHVWHLSVVDLERSLAVVLQPMGNRHEGTGDACPCHLEITVKPLSELLDCTLELIGTNINANPYRIGSKQNPIHMLVRHGIIPFVNDPPQEYDKAQKWFESDSEGQVEGIVWHCDNGQMFKLHRHHLQMKWPVDTPRLMTLPVTVHVDGEGYEFDSRSMFGVLSQFNNKTFQSLGDIQYQ